MSKIICGIEDISYDKRNKETKQIEGKVMYARVHFATELADNEPGVGQVPESFELPVEEFGRVFGRSYGFAYDQNTIKEFFRGFLGRPCIAETGVREFGGNITGRTLNKVWFIDDLIAGATAKGGNNLGK